jgi:hypothetical protein
MDQVHAVQICFFKSCFDMVFPSTLLSSEPSPSFRFWNNFISIWNPPTLVTCSASMILHVSIILITSVEMYKLLKSSLCSYLHLSFTSFLLSQNIRLSAFSQTLSIRLFSLNERNQVSHPYKTVDKTMHLHGLIFRLSRQLTGRYYIF